MNAAEQQSSIASEIARGRFPTREQALFLGDWLGAVFLHYEMEPDALQPQVPFPLDLWEGRAYVSVVAFSMRRLRPVRGGKLAEWLFLPVANHEFLNVRAYVRVDGMPGIFFMTEWLNNRFSVLCGPKSYGLPYRYARIRYANQPDDGRLRGTVEARDRIFSYSACVKSDDYLAPCAPASRDEFLLERYTAFTHCGETSRYFNIFHEPWPQTQVEAAIGNANLLEQTGEWHQHATLMGANYSPGIRDIWMGWPRKL